MKFKIYLFFIFLVFFSCEKKENKFFVYGREEQTKQVRKADMILIGFQYEIPLARWVDYEKNEDEFLYFSPDFVKNKFNLLFANLPTNIHPKVSLPRLSKKDQQEVSELRKIYNYKYKGYPYEDLVLLDETDAGQYLDSKVGNFLNSRYSEFYYGVFYLKVKKVKKPHIVNKYITTIDTEVAFTVYNRAFKKISTTYYEYSSNFTDFTNATYSQEAGYLKFFIDVLYENKDKIEEDVSRFIKQDAQEKEYLIPLVTYMEEKNE